MSGWDSFLTLWCTPLCVETEHQHELSWSVLHSMISYPYQCLIDISVYASSYLESGVHKLCLLSCCLKTSDCSSFSLSELLCSCNGALNDIWLIIFCVMICRKGQWLSLSTRCSWLEIKQKLTLQTLRQIKIHPLPLSNKHCTGVQPSDHCCTMHIRHPQLAFLLHWLSFSSQYRCCFKVV